MINISLRGGLANQLFGYAAGRCLQERGREVTFRKIGLADNGPDTHHKDRPQYGLDGLNTKVTFGEPEPGAVRYADDDMKFREDIYDVQGSAVLDCYFQSEKYFQEIRSKLEEELTPKAPICNLTARWAETILRYRNSCFLHVRRGDYVGQNESYHGLMPISYYEQAQKIVRDRYPDAAFFIFSDDISWASEHLIGTPVSTLNRFEDFFLMTLCKHAVIANSTFSWWSAYLGETNGSTVIAPKKWFVTDKLDGSGICPDRWIKL